MMGKEKETGSNGRMWHIDRGVSLGIVIALLFHGIGTVRFFSGLDKQVQSNTAAIERFEKLSEKVAINEQFITRNKGVATRVAVIDERTRH